MAEEPAIGVLGIGNIGSVFADKFLQARRKVIGFNKPDMRAFEDIGGNSAVSPKAVAEAARLIVCCLPNESAAQEVYFGADGLLAGLSTPHRVLDLASYTLSFKRDLARAVAGTGARMLDGEVSGTPDMLRAASGSIFLSGEPEDCDLYLSLCKLVADDTFVLGAFGAATKMKLINNLLSAIHTAAAAEAMALGVKSGFPPEVLAQVLSKGSGSSKFLISKAPLIAARRFDVSSGPLKLFEKYLRHIPELAEEANCATPLFDTARVCFDVALQRGLGDADIAVVYEVILSMKRTEMQRNTDG
jgi:3-hydroxyisobutyrate dehydrogenase